MRTLARLFLLFVFLLIVIPILGLGFMGFIPGLSSILGTNKARDLGIKYTEADRLSGRAKSQIEYGVLPENTDAVNSLVRTGTRVVKTEFTSQEITALANNRSWKYWPYANVQVKFNADGSAEISGNLIKDRLPGYGVYIGAPKQAVDFAIKFLPDNPSFYLKMKAALIDNKVSLFEPESFQIGRVPLPVSIFLSFADPSLLNPVYADTLSDMKEELAKVSDKRGLIISYINQRLSQMTGFYAKSTSFGDNKLMFDGSLSEKESTVR